MTGFLDRTVNDMRLIKADALIAQFHRDAMRLGGLEEPWDLSAIETEIESAPTIDAVPVVRCKDCKHSRGLNEKERLCVCDNALICKNSEAHVDGWNPMWPDDFCSYGEKKEADSNAD